MTKRRKVAGSNLGPDWNGQRCGAHAKSTGQPCQNPAVLGKRVCRVHGGARGSGAPSGERNGNYKHGQFTKEMIEGRKEWERSWRIVQRFRRKEEREEQEMVQVLLPDLRGDVPIVIDVGRKQSNK